MEFSELTTNEMIEIDGGFLTAAIIASLAIGGFAAGATIGKAWLDRH